ncbi:hypothetical protein ACWCL1_08755 [Ligilactobacillus sp. LYQ135]
MSNRQKLLNEKRAEAEYMLWVEKTLNLDKRFKNLAPKYIGKFFMNERFRFSNAFHIKVSMYKGTTRYQGIEDGYLFEDDVRDIVEKLQSSFLERVLRELLLF